MALFARGSAARMGGAQLRALCSLPHTAKGHTGGRAPAGCKWGIESDVKRNCSVCKALAALCVPAVSARGQFHPARGRRGQFPSGGSEGGTWCGGATGRAWAEIRASKGRVAEKGRRVWREGIGYVGTSLFALAETGVAEKRGEGP